MPPEALICELLLQEDTEQFYLTVIYDDDSHFSISKGSVYDYFKSDDENAEPCDLLEEYETLEETKISRYYEYFQMADKFIDDMLENDKKLFK